MTRAFVAITLNQSQKCGCPIFAAHSAAKVG